MPVSGMVLKGMPPARGALGYSGMMELQYAHTVPLYNYEFQ